MTTRWTQTLTTLALLLGSTSAAAQTACARQTDADRLHEEAVRLRNDGHTADALARFQQAYTLCPEARALGRIGLAEGALDRFVDAEAHLQQALASHSDAWVDAHRDDLAADLARVGARLGTVELTGDGPLATVTIDGVARGRWPETRRYRVLGDHAVTVRVQAAGCDPYAHTATAAAQGVALASVALVCHAPPTAVPAGTSSRRTLAWVSAGAAGVALVVGAVGLGVYLNQLPTFNDDATCFLPNGMSRRANCPSQWDTLMAGETTAIVGFGLAAAFGVTSAVLFATTPTARASGAVALRCGPGPGVVGLSCGGTF